MRTNGTVLKCAGRSAARPVREGTRRDALRYSVSATASHGYRRTNHDKRRAVDTRCHHRANTGVPGPANAAEFAEAPDLQRLVQPWLWDRPP